MDIKSKDEIRDNLKRAAQAKKTKKAEYNIKQSFLYEEAKKQLTISEREILGPFYENENVSEKKYPKALTASGANIVTNVDSFIQPPKSINQDEKRQHEEDARKEREDEGLRLRTEKERRYTIDSLKRELIPLKERIYCNKCEYFVHKNMIHNLRTHVQRKHENIPKENIAPGKTKKN